MKRLAFVIGISDYEHRKKLNNAVKDATDIAAALESLKYEVIPLFDCNYSEAYAKFYEVANKLHDQYDSIVFYYAGHGEIINGSDCLLMKDAPNCESVGDIRPRAYSLAVDQIMKEFNCQGNQKNIIIIDACRLKNDTDVRGISTSDRNTVIGSIPYQTFIAFSTSPGTPAKDGIKGFNSPFAKSILSHIYEENLDIEFLFKKVRNDIKAAGYTQYPWEHTCLLDSYSFNYGQLSNYYGLPYDENAFIRSKYTPDSNSVESKILEDLNHVGSINQKGAFNMLMQTHRTLTATQKFHLGRMIYHSATNGNPQCILFLGKASSIELMKSREENHLIRGIYYEIFFDENNKARPKAYGNPEILTSIENLRVRIQDKDSENFVLKFLSNEKLAIGYALGKTVDHKFHIELNPSELFDYEWKELLHVDNISIGNTSILSEIKNDLDNKIIDWITLRYKISDVYGLPLQKIKINSNIAKNGMWNLVSLADELPDFVDLLNEYCRNNTPDEVDMLSSLSYIDDVEDYTVSEIYQEDEYFTVKGNMNVSVHLEYDGEDAGNISFPGTYTIYMIKDTYNHLSLQNRKSHIHIDTDGFYY